MRIPLSLRKILGSGLLASTCLLIFPYPWVSEECEGFSLACVVLNPLRAPYLSKKKIILQLFLSGEVGEKRR